MDAKLDQIAGVATTARHGGTAIGLRTAAPFLMVLVFAFVLPFVANDYWVLIGTRTAVYWVLVAGLNLVVGFGGQLAIGYVALLTLGAYTASILVLGNLGPPWPVYAALIASGVVGAVVGLVVGLPALRLRTFYFAMTTLGFATIVTQLVLAWTSVTGGGIGVPGPVLPWPFDTTAGLYAFCLATAALCTWATSNIAHSRFGRALVALRDAEVAAEATGISKPNLLMSVFLVSGAMAGLAGALFATLQSYITPDAFTFDLTILFFIAILVGGRGSIIGPLLGTIILTVLPEFAAPLVAWSTFLYAVLLLVIVLVIPGGIADVLDFTNRKPLENDRAIVPRPALLSGLLNAGAGTADSIVLSSVALAFGGVRAIDGLDLQIRPGQIHGLIGPNGSGKTSTLNVISGYNWPDSGRISFGPHDLAHGAPQTRAGLGIARTFQTPRLVGEASVLQNVMIGGTIDCKATFFESLLCLPRHRRDERAMRNEAELALRIVGLEALAAVRADRLQHSELRFLEIARALLLHPRFLLLDEPAAGLSAGEILRLGELIKKISQCGTGILLVEHHADLIFDICDHVTVLNLGRELAAGTPPEIRLHKDVVSAYLGG
jgi:ABC-type branched-subunit amino acid transport system ATPase component/ABC-type branched-subunit amino acid transport system permease subunit